MSQNIQKLSLLFFILIITGCAELAKHAETIKPTARLTGARLGAKQHFISVLESQGILDRDLEQLPHDEELTRRRGSGQGLCRPELSVLLSYSKIMMYRQLRSR